jgi:hypothetical protein
MIGFLKCLFGGIVLVMLWATVWASLDKSVMQAFADLWRDPWGRATLFDAYFAFLTFYCFVAWRERTLLARAVWFVLIMALGNMAMSSYLLIALFRLPRGASPRALFEKAA